MYFLRLLPLVLLSFMLGACSGNTNTEGKGLFKLVNALDDPLHYCLDVPGHGSGVELKSPLMVHTCKPGADDESFTVNFPKSGQIYIEAYELCVEASMSEKKLYLKTCEDKPEQQFVFTTDKKLQASSGNGEYCMVVADGSGERAGGVNHLRRDLLLKKCADAKAELAQWQIPGDALGK